MTTPGARQSRVEKLASAKGPALLVVFLALVGLAVGVSIQRDYAQTIADAFQTLESQAILAEANHPLVTVVATMDEAADKAAELAHAGKDA